jgi:hypothetical protein
VILSFLQIRHFFGEVLPACADFNLQSSTVLQVSHKWVAYARKFSAAPKKELDALVARYYAALNDKERMLAIDNMEKTLPTHVESIWLVMSIMINNAVVSATAVERVIDEYNAKWASVAVNHLLSLKGSTPLSDTDADNLLPQEVQGLIHEYLYGISRRKTLLSSTNAGDTLPLVIQVEILEFWGRPGIDHPPLATPPEAYPVRSPEVTLPEAYREDLEISEVKGDEKVRQLPKGGEDDDTDIHKTTTTYIENQGFFLYCFENIICLFYFSNFALFSLPIYVQNSRFHSS